jgi:hypothetical protein
MRRNYNVEFGSGKIAEVTVERLGDGTLQVQETAVDDADTSLCISLIGGIEAKALELARSDDWSEAA